MQNYCKCWRGGEVSIRFDIREICVNTTSLIVFLTLEQYWFTSSFLAGCIKAFNMQYIIDERHHELFNNMKRAIPAVLFVVRSLTKNAPRENPKKILDTRMEGGKMRNR